MLNEYLEISKYRKRTTAFQIIKKQSKAHTNIVG